MLQIHTSTTEIQPDTPLQPPAQSPTAQTVTVPSQLWMASQLAKLNPEPHTPPEEQRTYYQPPAAPTPASTKPNSQKTAKITPAAAISARGAVALQLHRLEHPLTPQRAFRTYGRELTPGAAKPQIYEIGPTPNRRLTEPAAPATKLARNLADEGTYSIQNTQNATINLASYNQIVDRTLLHKSVVQACKTNSNASPAFLSPARNNYPPNIARTTQNEEANFLYRTPNFTSPRRVSAQNSRKDEHKYNIDQQKSANFCKMTLNQKPTVLKGKIYQNHIQDNNEKTAETWFLDEKSVKILKKYDARRREMGRNSRKIEEFEPEKATNYREIRQNLTEKVETDRILRENSGSPWKEWKMPERSAKGSPNSLDAAREKQKQQILKGAKNAIIERQQQQYFEKQETERQFLAKKSPFTVQLDEKERKRSGKAPFSMEKVKKFDLLEENKYLNQHVQRPLDRKLIAQMRNSQSYNQTTLTKHNADQLKQNQENLKNVKRSEFANINIIQNQQQNISTPFQQKSPFAAQVSRTSPPRSRQGVDRNSQQYAVRDRDIESAEAQKFAFANEIRDVIRDAKGQNLSILANQMLLEQVGNRLKTVKNDQILMVENQVQGYKSINDLKPKNKANLTFSKQIPRENGQKMSTEKIDQMAIILQQGGDLDGFKYIPQTDKKITEPRVELEDQVKNQRHAHYAKSGNKNPVIATMSTISRDVMHGKINNNQTNLTIGSASILKSCKFDDYANFIDSGEIYKKLHSKGQLVKDLAVQDRNDFSKTCQSDIRSGVDAIYDAKMQKKHCEIIGFEQQSKRNNKNIAVNDLSYNVGYGLVERGVSVVVDLGRQSGRFK
ncbi:hypothetical protein SS50377_28665 [Spironucleus salmonicida]|uniref:Uncharacterized protein n=1 Tax=Spironucleus salmonicida TaxID=348837 RepID=V6LB86_9EUKA|nr:hypothetical protein SS50377_28665 [Spironucleus salmonicida]|eukprot:EST41513.1 Hypothetical protein SS50377_18839 [Spironucleus salmonicida]